MAEDLTPEALIEQSNAAIREHAEAIGLICIYSAALDTTLNRFLERLASISETEAACIMPASDDLNRRCGVLVNLAYTNGPTTGGWTECVVGLLNFIRNEIAPRRNRYVHDDWRVSEGKIIRADRRVKAQKDQAFQPTRIITVTEGVASTDDMRQVVTAVTSAILHLIFLGISYTAWRAGGPLPKPNEKAIELSNTKLPVPTPLERPEL